MRRILFISLFLFALPAWSQTTKTGRIITGPNASKPATCAIGDQYNSTNTGQAFVCGSGNTWNVLAGGAGTAGPVLDCSIFAGANLGAKLNTCIAALTGGCGIADATLISGSQTLSTAVSIPSCVSVRLSSSATITQTAGITMSGFASLECMGDHGTQISKGANIDQITLNSFLNSVEGCVLEGNKGSFTGNGIVLAGGGGQHTVRNNWINEEAGDNIKDIESTARGSSIVGNALNNWGTHAYEITATAAGSSFTANTGGNFDCGATGAGLLLSGFVIMNGNNFQDCSAQVLVDSSVASSAIISNNILAQNGAKSAIKTGSGSTVSGNIIRNTVASSSPAVDCVSFPGCTVRGNFVTVVNSDGIDAGNQSIVSGNLVTANWSGVSSLCGINVKGDVVNVVVDSNAVSAGDNAADTNAAYCSVPSGTHNLNVLFTNNVSSVTGSGGATVYGFKLDNSANLNTNWSLSVSRMSCVHSAACIKRIDTQNNPTLYEDINPGDVTLDAGTGSSTDIWKLAQSTFANLPTPVGNGSVVFNCSDCTLGVSAASGGGASIVRDNGVWISFSAGAAPTISTHFNTSGDSISAPAGSKSFTITVGSGAGTSTGVLALPKSGTGWTCYLVNQSRADQIQQSASSTTSVTFTNFGTTFSAANWTNGDTLKGSCLPN